MACSILIYYMHPLFKMLTHNENTDYLVYNHFPHTSKLAKDSNDNNQKKNDTMRTSTFYTTIDTLPRNRNFSM